MELPAGLTTRPLRPDDARTVFDLMVDSQTHDIGDPSVDLEDVVGDWQRPSFDLATQAVGVRGRGPPRRLRGGLERPVRGRRVASTHRARRDRDVAGRLDPGRGAAAGRVHGRYAGTRRAVLATACWSGWATTSPGRPGCSSWATARRSRASRCRRGMRSGPSARGRSTSRTRSSRTPSTSGRTASR